MRKIALLTALLLACSCGPAVRLAPLGPSDAPDLADQCLSVFPGGMWYAVHGIEATLPIENKSAIIGVTVGDRDTRRFRCAGTSVEGVVLFDIIYTPDKIQVLRALPPLDDPAFLEGLARDVRFLFFPPQGELIGAGEKPGEGWACRWRKADRSITEVVLVPQGGWIVRLYDKAGKEVRLARAFSPIKGGFTKEVDLTVRGVVDYSLRLRLLESGSADLSEDAFTP